MNEKTTIQIPEPPLSRFVFADTRFSWVWFLLRIYVGWQWVSAGWEKLISPAWVGSSAGSAIGGFFAGALQKVGGAHPSVSSWYAFFLSHVAAPHAVFFSYLVAYGEYAVGICLVLGAFTGIAAFFGAFMNMNYLFAGTVSVNPLLLLIELFLILAWRTAGWWGVDRFVLPSMGVPWQPGKIFTPSRS